jgi:hypothetical protein
VGDDATVAELWACREDRRGFSLSRRTDADVALARQGWAGGLPPQSPLQIADPRMAAFEMDGARGLRERRIGKRACGDRRRVGQAFRFPEHRRAAVGTEVEGHAKSAVALARIEAGAAVGGDVLVAKEGGDAVGAAGALLAGEAAAERHFLRFALAEPLSTNETPPAYASKMTWRENNRRVSNGEQYLMATDAALQHLISQQWKRYWQRQNRR